GLPPASGNYRARRRRRGGHQRPRVLRGLGGGDHFSGRRPSRADRGVTHNGRYGRSLHGHRGGRGGDGLRHHRPVRAPPHEAVRRSCNRGAGVLVRRTRHDPRRAAFDGPVDGSDARGCLGGDRRAAHHAGPQRI
ncbi:MAG: hypothetical protein AVDCRST_MAG12-2008, partial [uncultured Rubrobacteraceae bacterium]